ncbi:hypothetical protein [Klebsiella pneumoniae]|uniref:hypothetical protein n=2 Tax=Klebsiella pneumoniae TaxID=573 RepID=UPI001833B93E|nr:hypothetical protein [Klebsiella pneumoniae]HAH1859809.1 hypothetical protein [Escherichia coli]
MYILIFKQNAAEVYQIGSHLLYNANTMMINDISLTSASRVEVKSDAGGLLHVVNFPEYDDKKLVGETLNYGQEIDFNMEQFS